MCVCVCFFPFSPSFPLKAIIILFPKAETDSLRLKEREKEIDIERDLEGQKMEREKDTFGP